MSSPKPRYGIVPRIRVNMGLVDPDNYSIGVVL